MPAEIREIDFELTVAIKFNDNKRVSELIDKQANINTTANNGWSALHVAAYNNDIELAEKLFKGEINPSLQSKRNKKKASDYIKSTEMLELFIKNYSLEGNDALKMFNSKDVPIDQKKILFKEFNFLENKKFQDCVEYIDAGVCTADDLLDRELQKLKPDILTVYKLIHLHGADVNLVCGGHRKQTAFHVLCQSQRPAHIEAAIEKGADFNKLDFREDRPLDILKNNKGIPLFEKEELIKKFIDNGARFRGEPVFTPTEQLINELDKAAKADLKTIENCINRGAGVNTQGKNGWTSLHVAAMQGNQPTIKKLLNYKGIDLEAKTKGTQSTPLVKAKDAACLDLLLRGGAKLYEGDRKHYETWFGQHRSSSKSAKACFLKYEIERVKEPRNINETFIRRCTEAEHQKNILILKRLHIHVDAQISRLSKMESGVFGALANVGDKIKAYRALEVQIINCYIKASTLQQKGDVQHLIQSASIIADSRRHGFFDSISSLLSEKKETNSTAAFKELKQSLHGETLIDSEQEDKSKKTL